MAGINGAFLGGSRAFLGLSQAFLGGSRAFLGGSRAFLGVTRPFLGGNRAFLGELRPSLGSGARPVAGYRGILYAIHTLVSPEKEAMGVSRNIPVGSCQRPASEIASLRLQ